MKEILYKFLRKIDINSIFKENMMFLCPFHNEKTPSFSINFIKKIYFCFSCGERGRINDFNFNLNFIKNKSFKNFKQNEVKKNLIDYEYSLKEKETILELNKNLLFFYKKHLINNFKALNFIKNRKIKTWIFKKFEIGFCSFKYQDFIFNKLKKYSDNIFLNTGLINYKNNKKYNILNNRILFPIKNLNGDIISFAGRSLNDKKPKYINCKNTFLFNKSKNFYGLYESFKYIKKYNYIIIVEGYIDVLTLYQNNFKNVLGLMGSNISLHHIENLLSYSNKLIFCLDSDLAGFNSIKKLLNILINKYINYDINFIFLPLNFDPDNYVKIYGPESLSVKIKNCLNLYKTIYFLYLKNILNNIEKILKLKIFKDFLKNIDNFNLKLNILYLIKYNLNINLYDFLFLINLKFKKTVFNFYENIFIKNIFLYPYIYNFIKYRFYLLLKNYKVKNIFLVLYKILSNINNINFIKFVYKIKKYNLLKYFIIFDFKKIKIFNLMNNKFINFYKIKFLINFNIILNKIKNGKKNP